MKKDYRKGAPDGAYINIGEYTQKYTDFGFYIGKKGFAIVGAIFLLSFFFNALNSITSAVVELQSNDILGTIIDAGAAILAGLSLERICTRKNKAYKTVLGYTIYLYAVFFIEMVLAIQFEIFDWLDASSKIVGATLFYVPRLVFFYHRRHLFIVGVDEEKWRYYDSGEIENTSVVKESSVIEKNDLSVINENNENVNYVDVFSSSDTSYQEIKKSESVAEIKCDKCGNLNLPDSLFCNICGSQLVVSKPICPKCKREQQIDSLFCNYCGTKIINKRIPKKKTDERSLLRLFLLTIVGCLIAIGLLYWFNSDEDIFFNTSVIKKERIASNLEIAIGTEYDEVVGFLRKKNIDYTEGKWYKDNSQNYESTITTLCNSGNGYIGERTYYFDGVKLRKIEYVFKDRNSTSEYRTYINLAMKIYDTDEYARAGIDSYVVYGRGERAFVSKEDAGGYPVYKITIQSTPN